MATQTSDLAPLQAIASAYSAGQLSLWEATGQALQALIDRIHCSRVSLWGFDLEGGTRTLRCIAVKNDAEDLATDTTLLRENEYRDYFAALVRTGVFVAPDARTDPMLKAMRGAFLDSHQIGALLDVAITINGRAYGIVCCEQIPGPRLWSPDDIAAARAAVSRAALLIASEPGIDFDAMPSVPIEPFGMAAHEPRGVAPARSAPDRRVRGKPDT